MLAKLITIVNDYSGYKLAGVVLTLFVLTSCNDYLEDYAGCERDCSEALQRNPYVVNIYELRGLARIQQKKYSEAIGEVASMPQTRAC